MTMSKKRRKFIRGDLLTAVEKERVLSAYVYRRTMETTGYFLAEQSEWMDFDRIDLPTDAAWLAAHEFKFCADGEPVECRPVGCRYGPR